MARRRNKSNKSPKLLLSMTFILCMSVVFSLLASFSWFFDLFSNFVLQYTIVAALLLPLLIIRKRPIASILVAVIFAFNAYELSPLIGKNTIDEEARYDRVKVLQFNVNKNNSNVEEITRWIVSRSEDFEVVALFEVNEKWNDALRRIKWAYPYHIKKDMRGGRNAVIFSRLYVDELEVKYVGDDEAPVLVMRGETTGYEIPFVLYGMHPPPPIFPSYAKRRNDILVSAAEIIAKEDIAHKAIVGDMNVTRFSPWFEKTSEIAGLKDSNNGLGIDNYITSWHRMLTPSFGLALDNILITDNIVVVEKETGPAMGSDHYPVITTLRFML